MAHAISVVIPTFNYGRFISDAIRGVIAQTHPASEIIVVDDGSTDQTCDIVRQFNGAVKYIRQENGGVCSARNRGVMESTGDVIAFLDADDIWSPTKLEKQLEKLAGDEQIGLVHCGMREFDDETDDTIRLHVEGCEDGAAETLLLWERPLVNVSGSVIMITRTAFDAVGGFDPRMTVGEDWDFCYRVARRFKVGFVAEPLVNYRSHRAAAHRNLKNMEVGMLMFYEKAFADPTVAHLRRHAYGNFHKVMAGSYFHAGEYGRFLSHAIRSVWMRPANLRHFFSKLPSSSRRAG